ncbi:DUF6445 family protein [Agrilutibacter solisilvae]|uniref:Uncharacterized protein n=1 Tax=Agrilutibacter solisilvae TaxID=2763317 RepID=A0A974Y0T7_9GAMM|nr:DUF6445 family protein [Lysobacter solisilvae]QSX79341.1 hypothetical protein I8J32_005580 [Lysobacter solisilvae]
MFNPAPRIQTLQVDHRPVCHVVDDALLEPERWVEFAAAHAAAFEGGDHNAYPGVELRLPEAFTAQLDAWFGQHLRGAFDARRTLERYSRLSLVTLPPPALAPRQWICHVDRLNTQPGQCIVACVLYLFRDASLGGTGFYRPRHPPERIARLVQDSSSMDADAFAAQHRWPPGYMTAGNEWFEKILSVPARFNRLIFYSGGIFHAADILAPERLSADPRQGRLTLNGFFTCRRNLA